MAAAAESVWSRFFTDLTSFLAACERQYGVANESYTEYVIDHLSLSCQSVLTLRERLASAQVPLRIKWKERHRVLNERGVVIRALLAARMDHDRSRTSSRMPC